MTGDATGLGQVVVVVGVALRALHAGMSPGQRKTRVVVIERRRRPACDGMTDLALLRESPLHVVGIRSPLIILQMAGDARGTSQIEVIAPVALGALQVRVSTCQREAHRVVIEACRLPSRGAMALLAGLGQPESHMVGIR